MVLISIIKKLIHYNRVKELEVSIKSLDIRRKTLREMVKGLDSGYSKRTYAMRYIEEIIETTKKLDTEYLKLTGRKYNHPSKA